MEEATKIIEINRPGTLFYRYNIVLSINKELTSGDCFSIRTRILELAKEFNEDSRYLEIYRRTPKEYYIHRFNSIFYRYSFDDSGVEYSAFLSETDREFFDSLFPKFVEHNGLYLPGTIIDIDTFYDMSQTIGAIKNEIISSY